ncbi:hypothetical protein Cgig2_006600 [Carnegiea gigantea]|uniref:Uncharacterized protein n=1 Tax=Carnegiea gigantea TaxID=171969 RepID=A0A9Q1KQQ5_9CARY|nr:hypothetical protein Cgig2_006600 [Carnegiea gigantea]
MATMTGTILQQVTKQVMKTMESVSSMRPLPTFDYVPTAGCEPSHRRAPAESLCRSDEERTVPRKKPWPLNGGRRLIGHPSTTGPLGGPRGTRKLRYYIHTVRNPLLVHGLPMTTMLKPHNARKYCKFHEQNDRNSSHEEPRKERCSIEIIATIAGGYVEGITRAAWKAQMWGTQQVLTAEQGNHITVPTNDFGDKSKARNLEIDFLVVDVPMAYNIILGQPTLHRVKAIIVSYLLQRQYKVDEGSVGKLQGDQRIA